MNVEKSRNNLGRLRNWWVNSNRLLRLIEERFEKIVIWC